MDSTLSADEGLPTFRAKPYDPVLIDVEDKLSVWLPNTSAAK